jgi:hypothetical protein
MNLTGLSVKDCPKACNAEQCVISGKPYCGHPRKGGLQAADQGNNEAIERLQKAQKKLAGDDAKERFS